MSLTRIQNNQITDASSGNVYVGVNAAAKLQDYSITSGKIANNLTYGSDLVIAGNLTVQGNTTTIDTVNLVVEDPLILLAKEQTGSPTLDIGFIGKRGTENNIAFVWDESQQQFITAFTTSEVTNTTIAINSYASLKTLDMNVTGNLDVTGNITFTGNVASLNVTGNIASGNLLTSGVMSAGGNVTGSNLLTGGTISSTGTVTGGNIATAGTVSATGNVTGGNLVTGGTVSATGTATVGNLATAGTVSATGNVTGGNVLTSGIVSATGTATVGNLATAGTVSATGDVTGGNLNTAGAVSATGTVTGGNIATAGTVSATGNLTSGNVNTTNVSATGNVNAVGYTGGNVSVTGNVAAAGYTGGNVSVTGNVYAQNFIGNISGNIDAGGSNTNVQFNDGDILAGSNNFTFDKATNIMSVAGTIEGTTVSATGNVIGGNVTTAGVVTATGNVTGGNLVTAGLATVTGNVIGGNITTGGQVTATGNVTGGNLVTAGTIYGNDALLTGNLTVGGNLVYVNVESLNIEDPIIGLGRGPNDSPLVSNDGKDRGEQLWYYSGSEKSAFVGYDNSAGKLIAATDVSIANEIVTVNSYGTFEVGGLESTTVSATGNVTGGNVLTGGYVSATGNVTGGNLVTGGLATVTGTVTAGNVATAGTVSATGNVTGGNVLTGGIVSATGNITGDYFFGNGAFLSGIDTTLIRNGTSNVSVPVANGNVTMSVNGTSNVVVVNSAGGDVNGYWTSTGNLTGGNVLTSGYVSATGNVTGANIVTSGIITATGTATAGNLATAGTVSATGNVTGGNVLTNGLVSAGGNVTGANIVTTGIVTATGTATVGNLSTAGTVSATGNVTGGNLITVGLATVTGNVIGGNITTAGVVSATGNVTGGNLVTAGLATVTGNVIGGNITTAGDVSATGNVYGNNVIATDGLFGNVDVSGDITVNSLTSNTYVSATGSVVAGNVSTTGTIFANLGISTDSTVSAQGNITGGNVLTGGLVSAGGNVTGANLATSGVITATGTATVGNLSTGGTVSAGGNVTGANVFTNGVVSAAGNITGNNISAADTISATGNITTNASVITTQVTTASGDLALNSAAGNLRWDGTGNIIMNSQWINNLSDPVAAYDAATKQYVDDAVSSGITIHTPVLVETETALNATYTQGGTTYTVTDTIAGNTVVFSSAANLQPNDQLWFTNSFNGIVANTSYFVVSAPNTSSAILSTSYDGAPVSNISNGSGLTQSVRVNSGVGAKLTNAGANATLVIDNVTMQVNDRVLVYVQANGVHNGVYVVSEAGNATTAWELTRSSDTNTYGPKSINQLDVGDYFFVQSGDTGAGESYVMTNPVGPFLFGYDAITFTQFSDSQVYTANTAAGLVLNGTVFSAKVDNNTTAFDGGGNIIVKAGANLTTPNIDSATGTSLSLTGNVNSGNVNTGIMTASGNVTGANLLTAGLASVGGNVTAGNVDTTNVSATGNVAAVGYTGGNVSVTGNVYASNFVGNVIGNVSGNILASGSNTQVQFNTNNLLDASANFTFNTATDTLTVLGTIQGTTVSATGNVIGGNVTTAGLISATGNVTGGNLVTGGLATVTGTVTAGNVATAGTVSATGNVTGGNLITGGIATVTGNVIGGNITTAGLVSATGNVDSGNVNTGIVSATGNVIGGNVTTVGLVSATGSVTGGNIYTAGEVSAIGNVTGNYFIGNGALLTGIDTTLISNGTSNVKVVSSGGNVAVGIGGTSNIVVFSSSGVDVNGIVSASGNITGGNVNTTNVSATGNVNAVGYTGGNVSVTGNVAAAGYTGGNASVTGNVAAAGYTGGNVSVTGNVAAAGYTGGNASITGNVAADGYTGGNVSVTGNVYAQNFIGNISGNIDAAGSNTWVQFNDTGDILGASANFTFDKATSTMTVTGTIQGTTVSATGNVIGGNVTTAGLVSATGNVTGSNLVTAGTIYGNDALLTGNLTVGGNLVYVNVESLNIEDPIIGLGRGPNDAPLTSNDGKDRGEQLWYFAVSEKSAFVGYDNSAGQLIAATDVSIANEVVTVNSYGTFKVGDLEGASVSLTGNVTGSNVLTGGIVSATGNVTGGNVLTSGLISATGNATAGNLLTAGLVSATGNVTGGNLVTGGLATVTGTVTAGNVATTGTVSATGNVTGGNVYTIGEVSATGNVSGNYFIGNGALLTGIDTTLISNGTSNVKVVSSGGNVSVNIGGTGNVAVFSTDGMYVTGVMSSTGTVTAGNVATAGTVSATGNVTGGNVLTSGYVSATGNVTSGNVNTTDVSATGNVAAVGFTGGNVSVTGNVYAQNFIGNISGNIDAAGSNTWVQFNDTGDLLGASANFTFDKATNIMTVSGTIQGTTVSATGNVIGGNVSTAGLVTATGNVTGGNVFTGGAVSATGNATAGNVFTGGVVSAGGNITGANLILTSGVIDGAAGGRIDINGSGIDTDFAVSGDTTANIFYIDAAVGTASFGNSGAITNAIVSFNTTDSIKMPVGNSQQRPNPAVVGMTRFNTVSDGLEVYTSTGWASVGEPDFTIVTADQFVGNGTQTIFTLSSNSTTAGTIVSINGVVQEPTSAYSVLGNQLTFTEAPAPTDNIDARILITTTTVTAIQNATGNAVIETLDSADTVLVTGNLLPAANVTYDLGSPTQMWNNGYFAGNTIYLGNLQLKQADANTFAVYTSDGFTQANIDVGSVDVGSINSGNTVIGIAGTNGNAYITVGGTANVLVASTNRVTVTGDMSVTGNVTAQDVNSLSDATLKTNIQPLIGVESVIHNLKGVEYDWKNGSGHSYGFLAQEVERVLPSAVKTGPDGLKAINYQMIIPFLVETIKQMGAEIQDLKRTVNKRRGKK